MKEYSTEAIVLDKEPNGELDWRVFLYTPDLGKIAAKVKSGRRITSKLSPHLEPLNLVKIRLTHKGGWQVADALKFGELAHRNLKILQLVKAAVLDNHADYELWTCLKGGRGAVHEVLKILGFDPIHAACQNCGLKPAYFIFADSSFLCGRCAPPSLTSGDGVRI